MAKDRVEWWDGETGTREIVVPVRHELVVLICPSCPEGEMEYTGEQWATSPYGYHHKCTRCGEMRAVRGVRYPSQRIVRIAETHK